MTDPALGNAIGFTPEGFTPRHNAWAAELLRQLYASGVQPRCRLLVLLTAVAVELARLPAAAFPAGLVWATRHLGIALGQIRGGRDAALRRAPPAGHA